MVIDHSQKLFGPCYFESIDGCKTNADVIIEDPDQVNSFGFKPTRFYLCEDDVYKVLIGEKSLKQEETVPQ